MELLRAEAARGRTIVLTTQILTEAEELCDDILIIDHGREIARGNLQTLKMLVDRVYEVTLTFERTPDGLADAVAPYEPSEVSVVHNTVRLRLHQDERRVLELVSELARRARPLRIEINGATLEDVFIELTRREGARS
jgi:ABC-2 type transport system ATP-binding protein